jgi:hypothetical protein
MSTQLDEYLEAEIQSLLTDGRIAELGITVHRREHLLVLNGDVESTQRRDEICRQINQRFPDVELVCDIGIIRASAPREVEEIS